MRRPIGSTSVSASEGTVTLVARCGGEWQPVSSSKLSLEDSIELLQSDHDGAHVDPQLARAVSSEDPNAVRFTPGERILWHYGRHIETARVIRDDDRGLVAWIPVGAARLQAAPADGRRHREVPLNERYVTPWAIEESAWVGAGVVRVAPAGKPWSVWFFRHTDGTYEGAYVNLELPHRRVGGEVPSIFSRDLVLDLWIDAEHPGSEDIWLKDADELLASTEQGRFTPAQAEAVRRLADLAMGDFITEGAWPLDEGWEAWRPSAAMDTPIELPNTPAIRAARARRGANVREG